MGVVDHVCERFAYIVRTGLPRDPMVKDKDLGLAVHGDLVRVALYDTGRPNDTRPAKARVLEMVRRGREEFVGVLRCDQGRPFVVPDDKKVYGRLYVDVSDDLQAHHGEKVCAAVTRWGSGGRHTSHGWSMSGQVTKFLGLPGSHTAEMHSVLNEFGIAGDFSEEVLEEAKLAEKRGIGPETLRGRKDLREVLTFTIDPEDAKDFDDALSIESAGAGQWRVGIHIADVTHYVPAGSALDKEALSRGNTTYLVGKAFPMLPDSLSNDLCSLVPATDKLTFSAVFVIDEAARVLEEWYGKTVICSRRRFTYQEAEDLMNIPFRQLAAGDEPYHKPLITLNVLAKKMAAERFAKGAIHFQSRELSFSLDEKGMPLSIDYKTPLDTHKLVEEFMLLANRKVAAYVQKKIMRGTPAKRPFVYRTHGTPDVEKLRVLFLYAGKFGHQVKLRPDDLPGCINQLMASACGKKEENILTLLALRSMAKAKYQTEQAPHFGLGFQHYTHFTSPIRRYPDIMTHRLLSICLAGGLYPSDPTDWAENCRQNSLAEKRSVEAERAFIKYKQVQFMVRHRGATFDGIVSGLTAWGIFVEIVETKCEGMIRVSDQEGHYFYDAANLRLVDKKRGHFVNLGDSLRVQVMAVRPENKTMDLLWLPTHQKKKENARLALDR